MKKTFIIIAIFVAVCLHLAAQPVQQKTIYYEYDAAQRLIKVIYPDSTIVQYSYDAVGNRLSKTVTVAAPSPSPVPEPDTVLPPPPVYVTLAETSCTPINVNGITYVQSGSYTQTLTAHNGGDSVITVNFTRRFAKESEATVSACESYAFDGITLDVSGDYSRAYTAANGCDSIVTLHLTIHNPAHTALTVEECGSSYTWTGGSGQTYTASGNYTYSHEDAHGCTQVDTLHLTINHGTHNVVTETACESFTWYGTEYTTSGTYTHEYINADGCASVDTLKLNVNHGTHNVVTETACESFTWHGTEYTTSGTYTYGYNNADGCASVDTLKLTVNHGTHNVQHITYCGNYTWHGTTYSSSGIYTYDYTNVAGCASTDTLYLTLGTPPSISILGNTTICEGESTTLTVMGGLIHQWMHNNSTANSITVSQGGVYYVAAASAEGCVASTSVTVTVNSLPTVTITGDNSFCQNEDVSLIASGATAYTWSNGQTTDAITVGDAGLYSVTGTDVYGCSNTATKTIAVNPTYNIPLTHSMCEGASFNFYGQNITSAGTYTHILQTVSGCDSVLTLTVTLKALPPTAITGNTTLCEGESTTLTANGGVSYLWGDSSTGNSISVSQSGVYTVTATNAEGCSNTANVTVTVNPLPTIAIGGDTMLCAGSSTTLTAYGADNYSWSTGANTAATNINAFGIYSVTGSTTAGCSNTASTIVLVSQLPAITISGETNICAGENTTLTANGGETYLWSDGTTGSTLTVNLAGTYQVMGYNAAGCYSIADATVNVWQPATSEFSVECPDACYIWNDQSYCQSGDYTQTLTAANGCDSVVTLHLTITVGIDNHEGFDFKVYPNPTTGIVNVEYSVNKEVETMEYHVFDAYGKLVGVVETGAHSSSTQTTQIDLSGFANGVYFVKAVADGNAVAVRKVVKL